MKKKRKFFFKNGGPNTPPSPQFLNQFLKGAVADPIWVRLRIATRYGILDNMVYMGTVNNSNNT